jgi:excinuclease UvrABC ATPase subunit
MRSPDGIVPWRQRPTIFRKQSIARIPRWSLSHVSGKIPVTIVTGFLGSGKTTLIRHLLQNPGGRRWPCWSMNSARWASMARS